MKRASAYVGVDRIVAVVFYVHRVASIVPAVLALAMLVVSVRLAAGVQRHRHPWFERKPWKELIGMAGLVRDHPSARTWPCTLK